MFAELAKHLQGRMEVRAIDLPGRGSSYTSAPLRRVEDAVDHCLPALGDLPDGGSLLLGYSMGALIGFELVRALRRGGGPLPAAMMAAAACAPSRPPRDEPLHTQPDEVLLRELVRFQGTTPALVTDRELMALVLPRLRADFELCETYSFRREERLPLPVHAIGGIADEQVRAGDLAAWCDLFDEGSTSEQWPGGHFFIQQAARALAGQVAALGAGLTRQAGAPVRRMAGHG
jgi:surfactin synthase thioesterase subunit